MKRLLHRVLAMLLGGSLLIIPAAIARANGAEQPQKEEVVYAKLQTDGSVEGLYVVNSFILPEDTAFTDYGHYDTAINLTTLDPLAVTNGAVDIHAPAGTFYYQGNLLSPELPWSIDITYLLNGSPVSAQQAAGASGRLSIVLDIADNPNANPVFIDNYALQIEMTLDTAICTDIHASGATIANSGQDKVINFIRMPGGDSATQYRVSMSVADFQMQGIRIAGIPFNISIDMPDTDEMMEDLSALGDAIEDLYTGATELSSGSGQLKEGYDQFHAGLVQMQAALDEMDAGLQALVAGNPELKEALEQIEQALLAIQQSLAQFDTEAVDLGELVAGSAQVLEGINQLSDGLTGLQQSFALTDQAVYEMTGHAYEGLQQANEATILLLTQQIQDLMVDPVGNAEEIEQLTLIVSLLGANNDLIAGLEIGINGDGTPGNPGLAYAAGMLAVQYQQIDAALQDLPGMLGEMINGIAQLKAGMNALVPNVSTLKGGLVEYLDGTLAIQQGFGALCSGFRDVVDGSADLKANIALLRDGLKEYADGTGELYRKTWDMDDQIKARIDEMMLTYMPGDFTAVSFVSSNNTNVKSVQFVMMTRAVQTQEAEPIQTPEPQGDQTFWQRFLALFGVSD